MNKDKQKLLNKDKQKLLNKDKQKLNYNKSYNDLPKLLNPEAQLFIPDNVIKLDMKTNNDSKQLEDIFKILFNVNNLNVKPNNKTDCNILLQKYDLSKQYTELDLKINSLEDLIKLTTIQLNKSSNYTIDIQKIINMKESLIELNNMIGMDSVKKSIVKQIIYFLQGIEQQKDMLHMVITGSPGTGKTSLGVILAKLYYKMGIIESKPSINPFTGKKEEFNFKIYKRSDLIAQYLGHTAIKTQKAIDECIGGVMFLDEAYSLGHDDKSDIYTKECLDTINQNLSENKNKFILIIAGYPDELDKCFFSHNEGLRRRFAFRYHIEKYTSTELCNILKLKIKSNYWELDNKIKDSEIILLINNSIELFSNYGGDIESWLLHVKIEHGIRIFGKHPKYRKMIILNDLINGLNEFKSLKINKLNSDKEKMQYMYL